MTELPRAVVELPRVGLIAADGRRTQCPAVILNGRHRWEGSGVGRRCEACGIDESKALRRPEVP